MTSRRGIDYESVGASATKEEVLAAARLQGAGLFPHAFCKIVPDVLCGDETSCVALHSDGAGTKSLVAYMLFREDGDASHFASLAQDALIMNIDDLLCVGATGPYVVTNTIGRHKGLIPAEAISAIVAGYEASASQLAQMRVEMVLCGGETADLGDLVRTVVVDAAVAARLRRDQVIDGSRACPGDVIVGLSSTGQATYEETPNSGIGSNGLTLARHALLSAEMRERYPETCAPELDPSLGYQGPYLVTDEPSTLESSVGEALLCPTRTYAPVVIEALSRCASGSIHAIVHCTGGGQTKCLRVAAPVTFIKEDLFPVPPLFQLIQEHGGVKWREMYRVFNMGHRMEIIVAPEVADEVLDVSRSFGIDARVVGRCVAPTDGARLHIDTPVGHFEFGAE